MDPNTTLEVMRQAIDAIDEHGPESFLVDQLTDAVSALDTWLSRGGFLPTDWAKGR